MAELRAERHEPLLGACAAEPPRGEEARSAKLRGASLLWAQTRAVLRKNLLIRTRGRPRGGRCNACSGTAGFLLEVLLPIVFIGICCLPKALAPLKHYAQRARAPVAVGDAAHGRWQPTQVAIASQTPRVYLAPDMLAPDAPTLEALNQTARAAATSLICAAKDQYEQYGPDPSELLLNHASFELWFAVDFRAAMQPGWTPSAGLLQCLLVDCRSEACVDYAMQGNFEVHPNVSSALKAVDAVDVNEVCPFLVEASSLNEESGIEYAIRMNHSDVPQTKVEWRFYKFFGEPPSIYKDYWAFVNMQSLMDRAMMGVLKGKGEGIDLELRVQPFPWQAYTLDVGAIAASGFFSLLIIFAFVIPTKTIATTMVEEKEQRLREGMMLLGLRPEIYWCSWFATHFAMLAFTSTGMALVGTYAFTYSDTSLIWLFYLSCSFAVCSFAFFMSTFFSSAKVATVMVVFLYIAFRIPGVIVQVMWPDGSPWYQYISVLPPCAIGYFTRCLVTLEIGQFGVTWDTLNLDILDNPEAPYTPADAIRWLVFDGFLYLALTWYFDQVVPKQWGTALPFYFPLMPSYWSPARRKRLERKALHEALSPMPATLLAETALSPTEDASEDRNSAGSAAMSDLSADWARGVHIKQLTKVFEGGKVAVDGIDLSIHPGEVTALLGHNGAGKTTTIAMLTGMLQPSAGDAVIGGRSVSRDMGNIRHSLGLCPQFDILWDSITVREHLEIFAQIKGAPSRSAACGQAERAARSVDLLTKIDTPASALSGGQRRKLSLAIAFMGDPEVVFLDEPTSGMDPYARRFSWEVIRAHRNDGCVIVLTTHFLDEADLLADRVAIMAAGQVAAVGSPLELKAKYGCGYTLTATLAPGGDHSEAAKAVLAARVAAKVPGAERAGGAAAEVRLTLPQEASGAFPDLLRDLEDNGAAFGVAGFGLSCTTLEDVFLRVGEGSNSADDANVGGDEARGVAPGAFDLTASGGADGGADGGEATALLMEAEAGGGGRIFTRPTMRGQFSALLYKRLCWMRRDKLALATQLLVPVLCVVLAQIAGRAGAQLPSQPRLALVRRECMQGRPAAAAAADAVRAGDAGLASAVWQAYPRADLADTGLNATCDNSTCAGPSLNATLPGYLLDNWFTGYDTYDGLVIEGASAGGDANDSLAYTVLGNQTAYHALPAALAEVNSAVFNALFDSSGGVRVYNEPLPYGANEQATYDQKMANDTLLVLCVAMAIAILSAGPSVFVVRERACGAQHVQMVSGVGSLAFWVSTYVFDMVAFLLPLATIMATFWAFGLPQYLHEGAAAVALLLFLFAAASLPLTYLLQRLFTNEIKSLTRLTLFYFLFAFVAAMAAIVVQILAAQDIGHTRSAYKVLEWVFRIIPHYCVCKGLFDLSSNNLGILGFVTPPYEYRIYSPLALEVTGWHMLFLAAEAVLFTALLLLIESPPDVLARFVRLGARWLGRSASSEAAGAQRAEAVEDDSVREERRRVQGIVAMATASREGDSSANLPPLAAQDLHKVYPSGKMAVASVSFAAERGQIFGLLGVNGAGKTTTFKMLTGDVAPSAGDALVGGVSVSRDLRRAREHLGYCPQFDATLPLLTAREHLLLYARLRGASTARAESLAADLLRRVGLTRYAATPSHALSGGNRRKLSVAIALVSAPAVVLLDEPSTGMDAGARRAMWDVLEAEKANRGLVLTSHSMEEVEATCSRLTIMVDGACRTVGTLQELKSWYGAGYTVTFRVRTAEAMGSLDAFVRAALPGAELAEASALTAKYRVPMVGADGEGLRLSAAFDAVETEVAGERAGGGRVGSGGIVEYSFSQASLEDVFIRFAGTQEGTQGQHGGSVTRM